MNCNYRRKERTHCYFKMNSYVQSVQGTHWEALQMLPWRTGTIPDIYLLLSTVRAEIGPHSQIEWKSGPVGHYRFRPQWSLQINRVKRTSYNVQ